MNIKKAWQFLVIFSLLSSLFTPASQPVTAAVGSPVMDGNKDLVWGTAVASDAAGDMLESNLDLTGLYVLDDEDNLYIGLDASVSDWGMTYGIYIDTDRILDSGGTSDPWGRAISASKTYLPEYALYMYISGGTAGEPQLTSWNGSAWSYPTLTSLGGSYGFSTVNDWLEFAIPRSALGNPNPGTVSLIAFTTGGSGHAQDTVPSDPAVTYTNPEWSGDITHLSAFIRYSLSSKMLSVPGSFNSEAGCPGDWQPECALVRLSDTNHDGVWKYSAALPAGSYEYKVAHDGGWAFSYPASNVPLNNAVNGQVIKFYYQPGLNIVHDNVNACIATVAGNFQSLFGAGSNWAPDNLVTWMTDPDGDSWYSFTAEMPAGNWEYKVALNESWDENYPSSNVSLVLDAPTAVNFQFNCDTEEVRHILSGAGASHDNSVWWAELGHDSRDSAYRNPGGAVSVGTAVTLRMRAAAGDLTAAKVRVWNDRTDSESFLNMEMVYSEGDYDWWQVTLPASPQPTIYWYRFIAVDGTDTDYYEDNAVKDGGWGEVYDESPDNSWQLTFYDPSFTTPDWVKNAVFYQVFPDRFKDGDPANNPEEGRFFYNESGGTIFRSNTEDWNTVICDPRDPDECPGTYSRNFYGGDLQGLMDKLDYLQSLGITAIYLNPIFESPSNHKYDTADYSLISADFGNQETYWDFIKAAHMRGMHVVLDGVFNHVSSDSVYFDRYHHYSQTGACENQDSPYRSWFFFTPVTPGSGACTGDDGTPLAANYESWFGYDSLPKLNSSIPAVRALIWDNAEAVARKWLRDGVDTGYGPYEGADGWRLDVGGDVDQGQVNSPLNDYWEGFRSAVHSVKPDAYIVGEEWGNATSWTVGGEWDATMNYQYSSAMLGFWRDTSFVDNDHNSGSSAGTITPLTPSQLEARLRNWEERYAPEAYAAMMNLLGSHDTNRALFMLDHNAASNPSTASQALLENPDYDWSDAITRLKGVAILQMTLPGAPTVYYGDEVGLVGPVTYDGSQWQDDPYNRQPYPWLDETGTPFYAHLRDTNLRDGLISHYTTLITARNTHPSLRTGDFRTLLVDDASGIYAYGRRMGDLSDAALVIVNQSENPAVATLDVDGYLPYSAVFDNALTATVETYTIDLTGEMTVVVPANSGAVLVITSAITQVPERVLDLAATEGNGSVSLSWSTAKNTTNYDVYRSGLSGGMYEFIGNTVSSIYTDTTVTNGLTYYYVVISRGENGLESETSNEASALPHAPIGWCNVQWPTSLNHTIGLTPTEMVYGRVWVDGVTSVAGPGSGVLAQGGFGLNGENAAGASWTWVNATFNTDIENNDEFMTNFVPEYTGSFSYLYRFSTTNGRDWTYCDLDGMTTASSYSYPGTLVVNASTDITPPSQPLNLQVTGSGATFIHLAWEAASDDVEVYAYDIYRSTDGSEGTQVGQVLASQLDYSDDNLTSGITYYYVVKAVDTSFNRSAASNQVSQKAEPRTVQVVIHVTVPAFTPAVDTIYIAGAIPGLPSWTPGASEGAMTTVSATQWTKTFHLVEGTQLEFKFTRGDWERVEKEADGNTEIANRKLSVQYGDDGVQMVDLVVANWRDPIVTAASPVPGATSVSVTTTVQVIWSQSMRPETDFVMTGPSGAVNGVFSYDGDSATVTFTPATALEPGTLYEVSISGEVDTAGDVQKSPFAFTFKTAEPDQFLVYFPYMPQR